MSFYIQKVKGQLHSDILMFCKITSLAIIQHRIWAKEERYHIPHLVGYWIVGMDLGCPPLNCADCGDFLCCWVEDACETSIFYRFFFFLILFCSLWSISQLNWPNMWTGLWLFKTLLSSTSSCWYWASGDFRCTMWWSSLSVLCTAL